jgi:hypothetical protein
LPGAELAPNFSCILTKHQLGNCGPGPAICCRLDDSNVFSRLFFRRADNARILNAKLV